MPPVPVDATPLPRSLRASGWLWLTGSLLYLAGWIVAAVIDVPLIAADWANDPEFTSPEEARLAATILFLLVVLGVAVLGAVYAILGFLLWRRHNWARVTLAVLGGVVLVVLVIDVLVGVAWRTGFDDELDGVWRGYPVLPVLAALQFGVTIAAIATMFGRGANRYFAGARRG